MSVADIAPFAVIRSAPVHGLTGPSEIGGFQVVAPDELGAAQPACSGVRPKVFSFNRGFAMDEMLGDERPLVGSPPVTANAQKSGVSWW